MHVEEHGTGPCLICLHGLGGGAWFFRDLGKRLGDRYRIVAPDLPGTGQSRSAGRPFSLEACRDALVCLIEEERQPPSVLGHSLGTMVALMANALDPKRISRLIFCGGLPRPLPAIRAKLQDRANRIRALGMHGIPDEIAAGVLSSRSRQHSAGLSGIFSHLTREEETSAYLEGISALVSGTAEYAVPMVSSPCLVITGEEDAYAPPDSARAFASSLPSANTCEVMPGCGHLAFLEEPAGFAERLGSFLRNPRVGTETADGIQNFAGTLPNPKQGF